MRLLIFLARTGSCSRRKALDSIKSGHVCVNGQKVTEPSFPIKDADIVLWNNRRVTIQEKVYILLNKPKGVTTTAADRFAEKTVLDLLPRRFKHLFPVGRLDKDTTGLLLLTNDGDLAYSLTHPSFEVDKTYMALLDKKLSAEDKRILESGIMLDGKKTALCRISKSGHTDVRVTIHEGRKRQIRRMFASLGYYVVDLCRLRQGPLNLGNLKTGAWRFLEKDEIASLQSVIKKPSVKPA